MKNDLLSNGLLQLSNNELKDLHKFCKVHNSHTQEYKFEINFVGYPTSILVICPTCGTTVDITEYVKLWKDI